MIEEMATAPKTTTASHFRRHKPAWIDARLWLITLVGFALRVYASGLPAPVG